jgi:hypothetical protein
MVLLFTGGYVPMTTPRDTRFYVLIVMLKRKLYGEGRVFNMGGVAERVVLGAATGGLSEVARYAAKELAPKAPGVPPDTSAEKVSLGLDAAKNAVQSKEAEARRVRASKRVSSVLTGGLGLVGSAPVSTATLQPVEARKSVLG